MGVVSFERGVNEIDKVVGVLIFREETVKWV
jgi:hypothetical protein